MPRKSRKLNDADSSHQQYLGPVATTSTSLIVQIRDGNSVAWNRFAKIYSPLIRHWCKKPGGKLTRTDRQDITQEVLVKVGKAISDFDEHRAGRSLRAWLRTITQNTIADYLDKCEKRKGVSRLMSDTGHIKEPYNKPLELEEDPNEKTILMQQILKTVEPLFSKEHWEVIRLLVFAEKNSTEVAEIMDMTPAAVRKIKSRIVKRIREEYESLGIDDDLPEGMG